VVGQPATRSTRVERHIAAPRTVVYRLLLDPDAIVRWRVPDGMVVEADEFETEDPASRGEMISTIILSDAPGGGTEVVAVHENLPASVSLEDNETGWRMALDKLAELAGMASNAEE
jgi:uncharacterized protein YndB with AHSA1/START domain